MSPDICPVVRQAVQPSGFPGFFVFSMLAEKSSATSAKLDHVRAVFSAQATGANIASIDEKISSE
jgi:hypothetical protein